jgi:hypothetical protein
MPKNNKRAGQAGTLKIRQLKNINNSISAPQPKAQHGTRLIDRMTFTNQAQQAHSTEDQVRGNPEKRKRDETDKISHVQHKKKHRPFPARDTPPTRVEPEERKKEVPGPEASDVNTATPLGATVYEAPGATIVDCIRAAAPTPLPAGGIARTRAHPRADDESRDLKDIVIVSNSDKTNDNSSHKLITAYDGSGFKAKSANTTATAQANMTRSEPRNQNIQYSDASKVSHHNRLLTKIALFCTLITPPRHIEFS